MLNLMYSKSCICCTFRAHLDPYTVQDQDIQLWHHEWQCPGDHMDLAFHLIHTQVTYSRVFCDTLIAAIPVIYDPSISGIVTYLFLS